MEEPGTYFWHGHSGMEKVDSFYGPLIVRPAGPEPVRYDEERTLLLSDNYHEEAAPLSFGLNRYTGPAFRGSLYSSRGLQCLQATSRVQYCGIPSQSCMQTIAIKSGMQAI